MKRVSINENEENADYRRGSGDAAGVLSGIRENELRAFPGRSSFIGPVSDAVRKTLSYYLDRQHPDGYWWYELESNVTIVSEYLMLLHFLGLRDEERDRKIVNNILRHQRADGTWPLFYGGKGDLSTTVEAYFALKLAGVSADDELLKKSGEFILREGGVEATRVFTKIYLALFGLYDWRAIPSIPVELNIFPVWFPLNIYNFSSWARSTLVPLAMILAIKPVRTLNPGMTLRELFREPDKMPPITSGKLPTFSWKRIFIAFDRLVKMYERLQIRPFRNTALKRTEQWILDHQEPTGDWGGIQPAMINSILALTAMGYPNTSEPVRKGLEALKKFTIENDHELALQSCISPVWDTALTSLAMLHAGMDKYHPSLKKACAWLASKQIFRPGDWSVKRPLLEPGGWAFEFENSWYPDVDDSAVVLLLLNKCADENSVTRENLSRGLRWVLGMQGKDGGWGAFDVDNDMKILNQLLFGDLEAMIDPSTPDLTGRVLELVGSIGHGLSNDVVMRAMAFLKLTQEKEGSWWGRWGVNHLYGTSTVLAGLNAVGEDMSSPYIRRAVQWLKSKQNADGGWGENCESYRQSPSNACTERSTPSQTAWAILALIAAGEAGSREVINGVTYLLKRQRADGTWDEKEFTGTGFPKYFYLGYHNYRNCFPLMALGKYLSAIGNEATGR
jgi:squalene-hopene/tetraprenyl-beta-curcumene cyclase